MSKKIILLAIILVVAVASGCSHQAPPDITGLIYKMEEGHILVVEGISDVDIPYEQWFEKGNTAIFFEVNKNTKIYRESSKASVGDLKIGQKVEVWSTGGIAKSYPSQGTAKKINIIADQDL